MREPGTQYPLVRPNDATTGRSFWKSFALVAETSAGGLNNVKWYTDGTLGWTGCGVRVGTTGTYVQATGTTGTSGTSSTIATSAFSVHTSGAKLSVTNSYTSGTSGVKFTDYVVMQCDVASGANPGTQTAETITWEYDET